MKKMILFMIAMIFFITSVQIPVNLTVFADSCSVNQLKIMRSDNLEAEALSEGSYYACANITKTASENATIIFAVYKNGVLYDIKYSTAFAGTNVDISTDQIKISLNTDENISDYSAKAFAVDYLNGVRPLCIPVTVTGFGTDNIYDNFSTVAIGNSAYEMSNTTSGRKFCDSDNLTVYPDSIKAPYGSLKYEGSYGKVVTGKSTPSTSYAIYAGLFDGKHACATFSHSLNNGYSGYTELTNNFYKNNLKIYAGTSLDNMSVISVTEWKGTESDGALFVSAKTDIVPDGTKYVKFELTNFTSDYSVSSFRITDGMLGYRSKILYDDYNYVQYTDVNQMSITDINRASEYGTLINCLQPANNVTDYAGVGYAGDFSDATFIYLATFSDTFINKTLAPLHESSYDRWGAYQDAVELAEYELLYSTDNGETLTHLDPDSYNFIRPGQSRALSVEIIFDSLPEGTNYVYIKIGNAYYTTRIGYVRCWQYIEGENPNMEGYPKELDVNSFAPNRINVYSPEYTADISGDTEIIVCAPNMTSIKAYSWLPEGTYGRDTLVAEVDLNASGLGKFTFPADSYPYGPIVIQIKGYNEDLQIDECQLQLYNLSGIQWNYGISEAPVNPIVTENNLTQVFLDDFTTMPTVSKLAEGGGKYSSHKIGYGDFSGIKFRDHDNNPNTPFSQRDTYFRINANQLINRTGLIASMHQDRHTGFAVKAPAYFECRFIAQNAKGSWPAFWLMTTEDGSEGENGNDEIDVLEAYGFDYAQPQGKNVNGYHTGIHDWGNTVDWLNKTNDRAVTDMANMHSGGNWYTDFHTYAVYIGLDYTVYYCDNEEYFRHPTLPNSASKYHYWMFNYAFGGSSKWPYDLARYNNVSDMYVDWVRVYGLEENVISNY